MGIESEDNVGGGGGSSVLTRRRGCSCTKDDFLPEESFKSWANYVSALKQTPARLADRVLTRSSADAELEVKARSEYEMKKTLTWWDLMWFGMGAVIGAGIFVLTGREANQDAGPAVVLSYVVSGVSALLSVFCYTEFAVEIPVAGGSFAYLRVELGDFMAFIAAGNILLEYVIGGAAVARSWTSYFATLCGQKPETFRIHAHALKDGYNHLDPIAVGVIIAVCLIAVLSTKGSSRINYIASVVHLIVIVFIIVAGLIKADPKNYKPKADTQNYTPFAPFGARGIFRASAILFFSYVGFDAVSTMAEETKNPARDIPIGLVGSMVITTALYCALAVTLCLIQPYTSIDPDAPFSVAFQAVGWNWAKYIVAAGALKGMTTSLLVCAVAQARYLTHISRTHALPPWFAKVNPKTGTPINATVVLLVATAVIAFFTNLDILANLLSISTLFIFMLVAVALLVRRYYVSGETSVENRNKLIVFLVLILGSSIATAAYWGVSEKGWIGYCVSLPIWILSTAGLWYSVPQARQPKLWGVPLVPWLPSTSIFIDIFLLGSIDRESFVRFGIWTLFLLAYYLLFGLHASYDTAKTVELETVQERKLGKVEEGEGSTAGFDGVDGGNTGNAPH
ncbi:cationic amino acid transporter 1 [Phtheirospermum japonicum]|uniref:Cationic amino acid transporter 1 n=1 Tax=Phtheirospermum japonicum TaxID=374723 RepID=A0A830CLK6_9LAMI|nr:cationic amino acid transporter 1 [Phtheirospermum japonicum]